MNILENLKGTFKNGNAVIKLIFINVAIFAILHVVTLLFQLFNYSGDFLIPYLAVPADIFRLLTRFWTIITYMFLHQGIMHVFFNMLMLFWFGKLFLFYFTEKQLVGLYLIGGIIAAAFYVVAYNLFPYYAPLVPGSLLMGASGSVMAIIVATALRTPDMEVRLLLLGVVKLKYVAAALVLISFFGITSRNAGGELAHLGGALSGFFFIVSLRKGSDITKGVSSISDAVVGLFKPRKLKVRKASGAKKRMTDAEYNQQKARRMQDIDKILDKIKTSGYESLTAEEKRKLFEQGNKN